MYENIEKLNFGEFGHRISKLNNNLNNKIIGIYGNLSTERSAGVENFLETFICKFENGDFGVVKNYNEIIKLPFDLKIHLKNLKNEYGNQIYNFKIGTYHKGLIKNKDDWNMSLGSIALRFGNIMCFLNKNGEWVKNINGESIFHINDEHNMFTISGFPYVLDVNYLDGNIKYFEDFVCDKKNIFEKILSRFWCFVFGEKYNDIYNYKNKKN